MMVGGRGGSTTLPVGVGGGAEVVQQHTKACLKSNLEQYTKIRKYSTISQSTTVILWWILLLMTILTLHNNKKENQSPYYEQVHRMANYF